MKGFEIITAIKDYISEKDIIVSSNGNISREVYHNLPQPQVYLRGSMGLPVAVGLGLALANPNNRVIVVTGDGNFLMGMGSTVTASFYKPKNLKILILDNKSYFTTGGQQTVSPALNYSKFIDSLNCEYNNSKEASEDQIKEDLSRFLNSNTFAILHLVIEASKENLENIPWHPEKISKEFTGKISKSS